jgi:murein DD-endopeptidase MepM/ murein hydrolase activator NlpD
MEDKIPSNTNNNIAEDNSKVSSALVVVAKKPEDLVEEDVDSQILSILGLEDVFDLTYEEYASLLKEAAVKGRMSGSQMTTESVELVTNELKRVKNKTGKFKVKPKKVDINKVLDRKQPTPSGAIVKAQKLIPTAPEVSPEQEKKPLVDSENLQKDLLSGIGNILESLITIRTLLQSQNKTEQKTVTEDKKEIQKKNKKERESKLEQKKPTSPILKSLQKPVDDFFGAIKKFFTNVLLGSVVLGIFKWLKDPANQNAVDGFSNFLQKNAPLILGGLLAIAALPIAANLLGLTTTILGGIPILIGAIKFLTSPAGIAALLFTAPKWIPEVFPQTVDEQEKKIQDQIKKSGVSKEEAIKKLKEQKKNLNPLQIMQGVGSEIDEQIYKLETGKTKSYQMQKQETSGDFGYRVGRGLVGAIKDLPAGLVGQLQGKDNEALRRQRERGSNLVTLLQTGKLPSSTSTTKPQTPIKPQTPKVSSYKSPFAGARDKEVLKASKITGNAPITVGEKAGYSASRGRVHAGRDIAAPSGTGLQVPSDSVITDKGYERGYGNFVVFKDSNGIEHLYGHMLEASPYNKGAQVSVGTVIGRVGSTGRSTGPHLHWEVSRVMGEVGRPRSNIIDPLEIGFPSQAPFTGKVDAKQIKEGKAQLAQTPPPTPSIPSPTGRSNIIPLPLPIGGAQSQVQSGTSPNQAPVPRFSSEDPNNSTTLVVRAIYNIVG